jgi:hypothetical protein
VSPSVRRGIGIGFVVLAVAVIAVSVVAAQFWRDFVYLGRLGEVPLAIGIAGVLLLVSLSWFRVRWRMPVYFLAGPLVIGILGLAVLFIDFRRTSFFVDEMAHSDGYSISRFSVEGVLGPSQSELRARSHTGLLSRDGQRIACFSNDPLSAPEWRLAGVRFVGADRIELSIANGEAVTVDIDPDTLGPRSAMVDRCTDSDYPTWSD